ncbi:MAG TPA: DUF3300 domain-containing protein, partial [Woeseiaceae bacterium]|nr:DUF3300 domain-containing protein [Woeseiaceae bacterium]
MKAQLKIAIFLLFPALSLAQVPVDDDGNVIGQYEADSGALLLSPAELEVLVGPIALYPDDLLAIVLPASAYPLQIVEAARFLEAYENDSSLEPNPDWDDAVVALTNYPEVVELLNEDLEWTARLGDAVVAQQTDVVAAVESFRDRAYAAGNLKSDEYQTVSEDDGVIYIKPAQEDVIYVPYYEPETVVYYQPRRVYYYYPRPRPVYYYPYAAGYHFDHGYFWGVTTAFTIGWSSHSLHTWHHSYYGHPYYGRSYWNHWYRRPSIQVYNTYYTNGYRSNGRYQSHGDRWHAQERRREYVRREGYARRDRNGNPPTLTRSRETQPIAFRERANRSTPRPALANSREDLRVSPTRQRTTRSGENQRQNTARRSLDNARPEITFRQRDARQQERAARTQTTRPSTARSATTRRQNEPGVRSPEVERNQPVAQLRNTERQATRSEAHE